MKLTYSRIGFVLDAVCIQANVYQVLYSAVRFDCDLTTMHIVVHISPTTLIIYLLFDACGSYTFAHAGDIYLIIFHLKHTVVSTR